MDNDRNVLEYEIPKISCSDDNLFHEGTLRIVSPGYALKDFGLPVDDIDAWYLYSYQTCAIFPYAEDARAIGEDVYSDGPMSMDRIQNLPLEELPDILAERLKSRATSQT